MSKINKLADNVGGSTSYGSTLSVLQDLPPQTAKAAHSSHVLRLREI